MGEAINLEALLNESLQTLRADLWPDPPILTIPPAASFATRGVQPPAPLYIYRNEFLRFTIFNSAATPVFRLRGRFLRVDGQVIPFTLELAGTTDRLAASVDRFMGEGFLLGLQCEHSANITQRGQAYALVTIRRGDETTSFLVATLIAEYLGNAFGPSWPVSVLSHPIVGVGNLRSITGTDPAAGSEINESVPTNARWGLHVVRARLVTSSTVASRAVTLLLSDGSATLVVVTQTVTQPASQTVDYNWIFGLGYQVNALVNGTVMVGVPNFPLRAAYTIQTSTENLQAGDNWGAPQILAEELLEV